MRWGVLILALAACQVSGPSRVESTMSQGQNDEAAGANESAWVARVQRFAALLPEGPRSRALMAELVGDWRREAGHGADSDEVVAVLEDEADAAFGRMSTTERLDWVWAEVLDRRLRVLSRRALAVARDLVDGRAEDAWARAEGRAILSAAEGVSGELAGVAAPYLPALRQALEDVVLEGLYLAERGAMSRRFQEIFGDSEDRGEGGDGEAPSVF